MPLPDAPPTDQSRIYREFASKTALPGATDAITADLIDNFKNSLYLDEFSEDELRRLLLLQMVTGAGSVSGPMPNTQHVYAHSYTDGALAEIFAPGVGEVYQLVAIQNTFRTGQSAIRYLITDSSGGSNIHCEIVDSTDEGNQLLPGSPVYIGYPSVLSQDPTGGSSGTGYTYYSVIRVR